MEGKTVVSEFIEKPVQSFFVNAGLSTQNASKIATVQQTIGEAFPRVIWSSPAQALHISLLDLLSARTQYAADKLQLFQEHFSEYNTALSEILAQEGIIKVTFSQLRVTPQAIIIIGSDNGSFERIREALKGRISLLPGTKPMPQLIHSTICRYKQEVDLKPIEDLVSQQSISFVEYITVFRLTREIVWPLVEFEVVKEYSLEA